MRLLLYELWPPAFTKALRDLGHQTVAVAEQSDLRGRPDQTISETAQEALRPIVPKKVVDYRPVAAAAVRAGRVYPGLIFTSNRAFPRANRRTAGRLVGALDTLLTTCDEIGGEHWLGSSSIAPVVVDPTVNRLYRSTEVSRARKSRMD